MYMGYRIKYPGLPVSWNPDRLQPGRVAWRSTLLLGIFLLLVLVCWNEGREVLTDWVYPGNTAVTRQALIHMASGLRAGETVAEAMLVFCREILAGV